MRVPHQKRAPEYKCRSINCTVYTPAFKVWQPEHKSTPAAGAAVVGKIQIAEAPEKTFVCTLPLFFTEKNQSLHQNALNVNEKIVERQFCQTFLVIFNLKNVYLHSLSLIFPSQCLTFAGCNSINFSAVKNALKMPIQNFTKQIIYKNTPVGVLKFVQITMLCYVFFIWLRHTEPL